MKVGDLVCYRDEKGAHFGKVRSLGPKWAVVEGGWRRQRVPIEDVKPWPPAKIDATAKPVKRGQ